MIGEVVGVANFVGFAVLLLKGYVKPKLCKAGFEVLSSFSLQTSKEVFEAS